MDEMWKKYKETGDAGIREKIILEHLPLVKYLSGRMAIKLPNCMETNDLESCGTVGLLEALEKYDPDKGVSFYSFAFNRVRGAMIDEIRKLNWAPRSLWKKMQELNSASEKFYNEKGFVINDGALAESMGISLSDLNHIKTQQQRAVVSSLDENHPSSNTSLGNRIEDINSPDPLELIEREEERQLLAKAILDLEEKDKMVLSLYFQDKLTLKEIGYVLEISESRVCQIRSRALARLRQIYIKYRGY